jgi:hypothetical protein
MEPKQFKTQQELIQYTRKALHKKQWTFLRKLLPYHPHPKRQPRSFQYRKNTLFLLYEDHQESVSWKAMVRGVFKGPAETRLSRYNADLKAAARNEVQDQIRHLRRKGMHVGHDFQKGKRFDDLLRDFLRPITQVQLQKDKEWRFRDRTLGEEWAKYHAAHAVLRMELPADNLRGNKGFKRSNWSHRLCPRDHDMASLPERVHTPPQGAEK